MTAWTTLLRELESMPDALERALDLVPPRDLDWVPADSGGLPDEAFSARGHVCHLRDIERDGYHLRFRRMLEEHEPSLASLDRHALAHERNYAAADVREALATFRAAREQTVARLSSLDERQLARAGEFAEYGRLTVRALAHYLRSHDLQHLACLQWLAGRLASREVAQALTPRAPIVLAPGGGRDYPMGRIRALFKADGGETAERYSISEWWLEPDTEGPGPHSHEEDDVFYVLDGTMSFLVADRWLDAPAGSFVLVPGGTTHDFENRGTVRAGVLNVSAPGGFEPHMAGIAAWFAEHPPGSPSARQAPT